MSDVIQLLPDHVANQIAAGEVVQRPASVVKELLENSIDAKATSIKLILVDAGKTLIQVIDDGMGMSVTDSRMCFERHATSKICKADDLFNLNTKGFRGEALASIAAIAHVELKTRQENQEVGTHIKIEGSKVVSQNVVATAKGTTLSVKNLFYNIPARRNFLKSNTIETRHIVDEFQRVALAHPAIQFILVHNDNEMYHLQKSNLRKRIVSIFGSKMNEKLVPVEEQTDILAIKGFVAKPEFSKRKRGEQFFFVNDRFIKSSYLNHAVNSAFEGLLEANMHPSYFLYLDVPKQSIDINIHPTKTEIKFDNEKALYAMLRATVKHSLGQYNIAPILDFNRDANLDTPYHYKSKSALDSLPKIEIDPGFNPFSDQKQSEIHFPFQRSENLKIDSNPILRESNSENYNSEHELFGVEDFESSNSTTFQIQKKYIVSSIKSGIVLIHQAAAHQRILYEEYLETMTMNEANSQQLLFPLSFSFSKQDITMLVGIQNELENVGFSFDKITDESIVIKGIPSIMTESKIGIVFDELLQNITLEIPDSSFSTFDFMAKSFAKSLSIKTGVQLNSKERESIVNNLFSCKDPNISPFGKLTFKTIGLEEIDILFNK